MDNYYVMPHGVISATTLSLKTLAAGGNSYGHLAPRKGWHEGLCVLISLRRTRRLVCTQTNMCLHVGLGGQALLHAVFAQVLSEVIRRVARGIYRAKESGACNSSGGGVRIILHMAE